MFEGIILKGGERVRLAEAFPALKGVPFVFHLSRACLTSGSGRQFLQVFDDEDEKGKVIGVFETGKCDQAGFDLFFEVDEDCQTSFEVKGEKSELHLTGYVELDGDDDMSTDDEDEEMEPVDSAAVNRGAAAGKKASAESAEFDSADSDDEKDTAPTSDADKKEDDEDSDGDDEKDGGALENASDDDNDDDDDDDDEDGDDDSDSEEEKPTESKPMGKKSGAIASAADAGKNKEKAPAAAKPSKPAAAASAKPATAVASSKPGEAGKKRKAEEAPAAAPAAKQQKAATDAKESKEVKESKTADKKSSGGKPATSSDAFEKAIVDYLKTNGKTSVGVLGAKVKRPADVKAKLSQFIKERTNVFTVVGQDVSLKA